MTEKKKDEKEKAGPVTREEFNALAAEMRIERRKRIENTANWKRFCNMHLGHDDDGRVE